MICLCSTKISNKKWHIKNMFLQNQGSVVKCDSKVLQTAAIAASLLCSSVINPNEPGGCVVRQNLGSLRDEIFHIAFCLSIFMWVQIDTLASRYKLFGILSQIIIHDCLVWDMLDGQVFSHICWLMKVVFLFIKKIKLHNYWQQYQFQPVLWIHMFTFLHLHFSERSPLIFSIAQLLSIWQGTNDPW